MPPKPRFTKEMVIDIAFEMTKEQGIEAVSARSISKMLNSTVSPLFTLFKNMQEIKDEVYKKTKQYFIDYISDCVNYRPTFKKFGMLVINFGITYPNLFCFLFGGYHEFMPNQLLQEYDQIITKLVKDIEHSFGLSEEEANTVFKTMIVFANGLVNFAHNGLKITEEEVSRALSMNCIGLVTLFKTKDGKHDEKMFTMMYKAMGDLPIKVIKDE